MSALIQAEIVEEAVGWRRELHRHPELAFQERRTAEFVAAQLARFGLQVHRGLGGTGVVGTLSRGMSRRTIAIRADMDALPITEESGVAHGSSAAGVMHACGHDGHVAIALAAAQACTVLPDLDGTVHFIFQPAEEGAGGAKRMVNEGLFRRFPCDEIYALHNWPSLPLGVCVARAGPMMAANATFEITITGKGCHAAMPHEGTDALLAGCQLVSSLQSVVSPHVASTDVPVLSATQIQAGDTWNVIPKTCLIRGTARYFDRTVGDLIEGRIAALVRTVARAHGCECHVHYERRTPATINTPEEASLVRRLALTVGLDARDAAPSMAAEDFAYMLQERPGCYLWLGSMDAAHQHSLHSPHFDFNDALLPSGAGLWSALVQSRLRR